MRNTKQGSSGNLVWTSISDGVIRRLERFQPLVARAFSRSRRSALRAGTLKAAYLRDGDDRGAMAYLPRGRQHSLRRRRPERSVR
jgi:hypothetical protein